MTAMASDVLEIYGDNNSIVVSSRNILAPWMATKGEVLTGGRRNCAEAKNNTARFSPDLCQARVFMDLIPQLATAVGRLPQRKRHRSLASKTHCDGWV